MKERVPAPPRTGGETTERVEEGDREGGHGSLLGLFD